SLAASLHAHSSLFKIPVNVSTNQRINFLPIGIFILDAFIMDVSLKSTPKVSSFAKVGLVAKGIVYVLLGIFAFMAAFHLGGQSTNDTNKRGVFDFIQEQTGGQILLALAALGL